MNILTLVRMFPGLYKAGTAVHLIGPPGCGKSDVLRYEVRDVLSREYGERFGFCGDAEEPWLLPTLDAPDIRGFLVPSKTAEGEPTSFFTRSPLFPSDAYLRQYPRGIFVLDERSGADLLTQKAIAPIILDKMFGHRRLPEGWMVVSCSNRMADRVGNVRPPMHLVNRERQIEIEVCERSWAVWAERHNIHPLCIAYARRFPGAVFSATVPAQDGPFSTARSFTAAARYLALQAGMRGDAHNMALPDDAATQEIVAGSIGRANVAQMFAFFKVRDQLPDVEDILLRPKTAKCPTALDAAYAAMQLALSAAKQATMEPVWQYMERLPIELQASAASSLVEKGLGQASSKSLGAWLAANRALIISALS